MIARSLSRILVCSVAWVSTGCAAGMPEPAAPLTPPTRICTEAQPSSGCRAASVIDAALRAPELVLLGAAETPQGRQGARMLTLALPAESGKLVFRAKWRAHSTLSSLNDPRRELGAYAVQRLFLEPHEYVVPPSVGHCFDLAEYRKRVDPPGARRCRHRCVFACCRLAERPRRTTPRTGWLSAITSVRAAWFRRARPSDSPRFERAHVPDRAWRQPPPQFIVAEARASAALTGVDNSLSFGSFETDRPKTVALARAQHPPYHGAALAPAHT